MFYSINNKRSFVKQVHANQMKAWKYQLHQNNVYYWILCISATTNPTTGDTHHYLRSQKFLNHRKRGIMEPLNSHRCEKLCPSTWVTGKLAHIWAAKGAKQRCGLPPIIAKRRQQQQQQRAGNRRIGEWRDSIWCSAAGTGRDRRENRAVPLEPDRPDDAGRAENPGAV